MKKIISIVLSLIMVLSMVSSTYAHTYIGTNSYDISVINQNKISFIDKNSGQRAIISIIDNKEIMKTEIRTENGDHYDGEIVWDKENNTIYSSYTKNTVFVDTIGVSNPNEKKSNSIQSYKRYRISYKELSDFVSDTSNTYTVAAAIIVVVAAIAGITIETGPGLIVTLIGASMVVITWGLNAQRPDKGVYVDVDKYIIKKHQGNQTYNVEVYRISNVGTY